MATAHAEALRAVPASPFASFAVVNHHAVDGSTLSLRANAGRLSRVLVMPDGKYKTANFILLTDRLGTVSEGEGNGNIVGLFVIDGQAISTTYADGRSEILATDAAGRFSLMAQDAKGDRICSSFYPAGHQFSAQEREAALAQYARRLGLDPRPLARWKDHGCDSGSPTQEPQAGLRANGGNGVLKDIMARVFALYGRKEPAVPAMAGLAQPPSQSWDAFDRFYVSFIANHEGGYTENDGNGAPANFGINQGANPDVDVLALTQAEAEQILYERYWLASGADQMPLALAAVHGDTAINMGLQAASELLAQSGGDPGTYLDLRDEKYRAIATANPGKANYLPVWLRRTQDLRELINGGASADRVSYSERTPQRQAWSSGDPDW